MFLEKIKLDFECDNLPLRLLTSQWQCNERSVIFVWYRWTVAVFFSFSFINSVIFSVLRNEAAFMFIFLSRWNLFVTMITTSLGAILVTSHHLNRRNKKYSKTLLKFYWFASNCSTVFACAISAIYWSMLYRDGHNNLNNYLVHATNSSVLIIDLFISRHPYRLSHMLFPMACGSLYMFFTFTYTVFGGVDNNGNNYVYSILDWKEKPQKSAIVGVCSVIFLGIIHVIIGGIHRIRKKIHQIPTREKTITKCEHILPFVNNQEGK